MFIKKCAPFLSMVATTFTEIAQQQGVPLWLLVFVILWSLAWKGVAWWKSARNNHSIWFVAFFLIHTIGILEILYIFLFSKMQVPSLKEKRMKKSSTLKPIKRSR